MKWLGLLLSTIQVLSSLQLVSSLQPILHPKCDVGCKFTRILAEDEIGPEHVLERDLEKYASGLAQFIKRLPFNQNLTRFDDRWKFSVSRLTPILVNLTPIDNTQLNFLKVVKLLMKKTTDRGKKKLLIESALTAFETRPDTRDHEVDIEWVYKELTGTCNTVEKKETEMGTDYADYADYAGESWGELSHGHRQPRVIEPEAAMDFFREDNRLHEFHLEWHHWDDSKRRLPNDKESLAERFFNAHRQFLNRYMVERKIAGLGGITPLTTANRNRRFSSRYSIRPENDPKGLRYKFASNKDECELDARSKRELNLVELTCTKSIESGDMARFGKECMRYHGQGHTYISENCGGETRLHLPGGRFLDRDVIISNPVASARDPLFYRWHLEVDSKYAQFLAMRGLHAVEAVRPPQGITVAHVELQSRCPTNNVETFWENYNEQGAQFFRLNHLPYSVKIRLNNHKRFRGRVIVRLFLFLEEFANSLTYPMEMDRFVQDLRGQATEEIVRWDTQSTITMQPGDKCGWPTNLLLPKGKTAGFSRFRLAVFVNDIRDSRTNIGISPKQGSPILCGARPGSGVVPDTRSEGFPFELGWRFNKAQVMNNHHRDFGNITARIQIHNVGLLDRGGRCMAQL